jgi:hypothetical protein
MIRLALALAALTGASAEATHMRRSAGYAGSLPDGQFAALATGDCTKLKGSPELATQMVPFLIDCAIVIPSPDRRFTLQKRSAEGALTVFERQERRLTIPLDQPAMMMWNPASRGFFINDGEGSGQTSRLRYFSIVGGHWQESRRFDAAAQRFFLERQKCRRGAYANVSGIGWTASGSIKAVVQEGVHSAGCLQPADGNIALEVVANPLTGSLRLDRVRIDH